MKKTVDLTGWTREELSGLHKVLEEKLHIEVNLERALKLHYLRCDRAADTAAQMLERGEASAGTAAVLTAATGVLKELARLETEVYNAERLKLFEQAVQTVIKTSAEPDVLLEALEAEMERLGIAG